MLESFLISFISLAGAEIGDKTQLLALLLVTRFRKPLLIFFGVLIATLLGNLIAGLIGKWIGSYLSGTLEHAILAASYFIAFIWMLIPEQAEKQETTTFFNSSVLLTTIVLFFIAEMGDKTQIITTVLAAQFPYTSLVILGATLGMMLANTPVILLSHHATDYISIKFVKIISASIFLALCLYELFKLVLIIT